MPKVTEKAKKKISKYDVDRIGQRGTGKGVNVYSLEEERDLGRQLSEQLEMMTKLITDPVIRRYVDRLGQAIVCNFDAQVPFTSKVVESDEITVALPGGYSYVNSGPILAADSEAELAGLMAHEVGHVAARHATRAETRMQIRNVLSIALVYFGGPAALFSAEVRNRPLNRRPNMNARIVTFSSHGDTSLLEYDPANADMDEVNKVIAEYEARTGAQPFDMATGERIEKVTRQQNEVLMVHPIAGG